MKYNTVIFDFDGVIVDSWLGIAKGFVKALGAYGITETIENVKKMIGPPFAKLIIEKYGFDQEEGKKAIMIHRKYVQEHGCFEATLYDGVYEMLQTLDNMGVQMAIASNKPIENVKLQIKYFEIEKFFKEGYSHFEDDYFSIPYDYINVRFPGTGDVFSAVLITKFLKGLTLKESCKAASDFVRKAMEKDEKIVVDKRMGMNIEDNLQFLK